MPCRCIVFTPMRSRTRAIDLILLVTACGPHNHTTEPGAASVPVDPRAVAEWVRGERYRPVPIDARGSALGLQVAELGKPLGSAVSQPGSCSEGLHSLLPVPGQPGVVLMSDAEGRLFRYEGALMHPLALPPEVPPVVDLLGLAARTSPLQLLVTTTGSDALWELELGDDHVLSATPMIEGPQFTTREQLLAHYWVGRCTEAERDCLAIVRDDEGLTIDRRAHPEADPEIVMTIGDAYVADVGYADATGRSVYLLTLQPCTDPSTRGSGVIEAEPSD